MDDANGFVIEDGVLEEYTGPGGEVVIPKGVTRIGEWAFFGCTGLSSVVIPGSVTAIGEDAFDDGVELVRQGAHAPDYPSGI